MTRKLLILFALSLAYVHVSAQQYNDKLGAWYMYFWNTTLGESNFGFQGDLQYRSFDYGEDLEQIMLRGGFTWNPAGNKAKLTLGYANITTGVEGESTRTVVESRIYQEALLPQRFGRFFLTHRFRYEQRFVNDDFRTRYRYNLFLNVDLNGKELKEGCVYLALYNELFVNGQRNVDAELTVEYFDRNRLYGALGYSLKDNLRFQLGVMRQTSMSQFKDQIQVSAHHKF
ncbi:DUF2490 domain-containing protein [Sanyastnella coralliicola]|uniref:DUF2490 domain-containing protein n=1 Tax=Sanyastnella coralliicola TaxID=3069118 RepID=UPI0027B8F653|nr:DUF2490 domain-containing protein [Longitalea sp. SCSIO 12813]